MHKIWWAKIAHYHYLVKNKIAIYHCFENIKRSTMFLKLEYVKLKFAMKLKFQKLEIFKKMYFKFSRKFFMVLKFHKLKYHGKLNFTKLEYPKNDRSYKFPK